MHGEFHCLSQISENKSWHCPCSKIPCHLPWIGSYPEVLYSRYLQWAVGSIVWCRYKTWVGEILYPAVDKMIRALCVVVLIGIQGKRAKGNTIISWWLLLKKQSPRDMRAFIEQLIITSTLNMGYRAMCDSNVLGEKILVVNNYSSHC